MLTMMARRFSRVFHNAGALRLSDGSLKSKESSVSRFRVEQRINTNLRRSSKSRHGQSMFDYRN
jgi:uncharacterized protein (UPF0332 family)